jgi:hypothetical protein
MEVVMAKDTKRSLTSNRGGFFPIYPIIVSWLSINADRRVNPVLKVILIEPWFICEPDRFSNTHRRRAVIGLGLYMFVELCPPDVVAEHRAALGERCRVSGDLQIKEEDVVDGEFRDEL